MYQAAGVEWLKTTGLLLGTASAPVWCKTSAVHGIDMSQAVTLDWLEVKLIALGTCFSINVVKRYLCIGLTCTRLQVLAKWRSS